MSYVQDELGIVWDLSVAISEFGRDYVEQNFTSLSIKETILFEQHSAQSEKYFKGAPYAYSAVKKPLIHYHQ